MQVTVDDPDKVISDEVLDRVLDRSTDAASDDAGAESKSSQFKVTVHKAASAASLLGSLATA